MLNRRLIQAKTQRAKREADKLRKRKSRALIAIKKASIRKAGHVAAAIEALRLEEEERARLHKRPDAKPTPLDALLPKLTEPQVRAADRIVELWQRAPIVSRRVTAAYGAGVPGNDEMPDSVVRAWHELADCYRVLEVEEREAVHGLVCCGEQRDPVLVLRGLNVAAAHWGY